MKVLFDHKVFTRARYSGVSRYICELARHLPPEGVDVTVAAMLHTNGFVGSLPETTRFALEVPKFPKSMMILDGINDLVSGQFHRRFRGDILHQSHYNTKLLERRCRYMVSTCHDMMHELNPDQFKGSTMAADKRSTFDRSDAIIAISEHTKADMVSKFGYNPDKIVVVHHGINALPVVTIAPLMERPYILFVGHRQNYKNFAVLLDAYQSNSTLRENFALVCFGGPKFTADESADIEKRNLSNRVIWRGGDDSALANYYRSAACFVFPSNYEGFGMPLLEAMISDCPVVCSRASCFPEIAGDAAQYFHAGDPADLTIALLSVLEDPRRQEELKQRGAVRAAQFSWRETAVKTKAVYDSLM